MDRYAYVNNAPVNLTDPSGHCIWDGCLLEIALVVTVSAFILTGDTIQPATAPIDTNASDPLDLIQLGLDQADHANIIGEGLQSLQDDPSVKDAQDRIVNIIKSNPEYGKQAFSLSDISDPNGVFTADGPSRNWKIAAVTGNYAFWMVHSGSISATDIRVLADGTVSTTWKIKDTFDFVPGENHTEEYNKWATRIHLIYNDLLGAKESYPTEARWNQIIPAMKCRRCNEFID